MDNNSSEPSLEFVFHSIKEDVDILRDQTATNTLSEMGDVFNPIAGPTCVGSTSSQRLLFAASILARSTNTERLEASLVIASYFLSSRLREAKAASAIVLEQLANSRTIALAQTKDFISETWHDDLPLDQQLQSISRRVSMSAAYFDMDLEGLNRFQQEFWNELNSKTQTFSVSAPTAAGKSYIIYKWLVSVTQKFDEGLYVYIAPTNALCDEVCKALRTELSALEDVSVFVTTAKRFLGSSEHFRQWKAFVHVVTQEGAAALLSNVPSSASVRLLVVDEAYKVEDGSRGIVLQGVISDYGSRWPEKRTAFLSPRVANPEYFERYNYAGSRSGSREALSFSKRFEQPLVRQQFFLISGVHGNRSRWSVSHLNVNAEVVLGGLDVQRENSRVTNVSAAAEKILALGPTLIYCSSRAKVRDTARNLYDRLRDTALCIDLEKAKSLAEFVRTHIHPDYPLANYLERGIGIHYGDMPLLVRRRVEELFANGHLLALVCTSSLLEGVNINCRNVVVSALVKGKEPFTSRDFWNLSGRAGRWGNEFEGNVFFIADKHDEGNDFLALARSAPSPVASALAKHLSDTDTFSLLSPETFKNSVVKASDASRAAAAYIVSTVLVGGTDELDNVLSRVDMGVEQRADFKEALGWAAGGSELSKDVVFAHRTISPISMINLFKYFSEMSDEELVLMVPKITDYNSCVSLLETINVFFFCKYSDNQRKWFARLFTKWNRHEPLSAIIADHISYWEPRARAQNTVFNRVKAIDDVLDVLKNKIEFEIPRYINVYIDVLGDVLQKRQILGGLEELENVRGELDIGGAGGVFAFLMDIGLARESAALLQKEFSASQVGSFLKALKSADAQLKIDRMHQVIRSDVMEVLGAFL